jgi:Enoyl-CoA hydratase/isomerase
LNIQAADTGSALDAAGAPAPVQAPAGLPTVDFRTDPARYKHWRLSVDGEVATLTVDVDEGDGLVPGYELRLNSYDLGVDIELYDAVQRLRFEHPDVKAVVVTSGKEKIYCAGANIRMLAASSHPWKVNFCKFTNETRNGIQDATENSGQTYQAALNGTASGGGYELALACDRILLVDDRSSAVSLPGLPLLAVLPGIGSLARVVDKRHVRRDPPRWSAPTPTCGASTSPTARAGSIGGTGFSTRPASRSGSTCRTSRSTGGSARSPRSRRRRRASAFPPASGPPARDNGSQPTPIRRSCDRSCSRCTSAGKSRRGSRRPVTASTATRSTTTTCT